jgi:hypothetical protein
MRRHYRNHTTPGAPRGSGAACLAGAPQPTRIPPPPHTGTQHGERGPTPRATKSGPNSEDEEEFDKLDSDMDVDPPPRTSERRSANGNAYPTPPHFYPSHSVSPHLHSALSSPLPRRRGASRSPSYSPRERRHPYVYSPPRQPSLPHLDIVHLRYQHTVVPNKGYADPPNAYRREWDYSPHSSNGSPPSHPHRHSDRREYDSSGDDEQMVHRRQPMTPGLSFHSSSPLPSVGRDDVGVREVKKEYQYNPSRLYEDARVSTTLRRAVYWLTLSVVFVVVVVYVCIHSCSSTHALYFLSFFCIAQHCSQVFSIVIYYFPLMVVPLLSEIQATDVSRMFYTYSK